MGNILFSFILIVVIFHDMNCHWNWITLSERKKLNISYLDESYFYLCLQLIHHCHITEVIWTKFHTDKKTVFESLFLKVNITAYSKTYIQILKEQCGVNKVNLIRGKIHWKMVCYKYISYLVCGYTWIPLQNF